MATAASVPISARRWEPCVRTIRVRGLDLTPILNASVPAGGCDLLLEIRVSDDAPGAALVVLGLTGNGNAQGLRVSAVQVVDGLPESTVIMRINEETMESLPFQGETGDPSVLRYGLQVTYAALKKTRLYGDFEVLPGAVGSDAAPSSRPAWDGVPRSIRGGSTDTVGLTISADEVVLVTIDGAEVLIGLINEAKIAADEARSSAAQAAVAAQSLTTIVAGLANQAAQIANTQQIIVDHIAFS